MGSAASGGTVANHIKAAWNMTTDLHIRLRSEEAFGLARSAIDVMQQHQVWPTPLNFEICLEYLAHPDGALAQELRRLLAVGELAGELHSERLAAEYLPRLRLHVEIQSAGASLAQQLDQITCTVDIAQKANRSYGRTLDAAGRQLVPEADLSQLAGVVGALRTATKLAQVDNDRLSAQLARSTAEVRQVREHLEQVRREAMTDGLTRLSNRKAFDDALQLATEAAGASKDPLCLALLDIDHFKRINDGWGHQTGDQVIRYVAQIIAQHCAKPRLAARYGGEEFAIIFPNADDASAAPVLDAIRTEIASRVLKRRSTGR